MGAEVWLEVVECVSDCWQLAAATRPDAAALELRLIAVSRALPEPPPCVSQGSSSRDEHSDLHHSFNMLGCRTPSTENADYAYGPDHHTAKLGDYLSPLGVELVPV